MGEVFEHESKKPKLQEASKECKKQIKNERFSCAKCNKTYGSKQRLNVHIENSHADLVGSFKEQEMKMLAENTPTDFGGSFSMEDEQDENMENGPLDIAGFSEMKEDTQIKETKYEDIDSKSTMEAINRYDSQGSDSEGSFSVDADYHRTNLASSDSTSSEMEQQDIYSTPSLNEYSANLNTNLDNIKESAVNGDKQPKTILCVLCDKKFRTNEGLNIHIAKRHSKADKEVHTATMSNATYGIDTSKSDYLTKIPTMISKARGASIKLFTEEVQDLPQGWKSRTVESKDSVRTKTQKHFLTPSGVILKTGLAVLEFLRLEGRTEMGKILEIARALKIKEKVVKKLLGDQISFDSYPMYSPGLDAGLSC